MSIWATILGLSSAVGYTAANISLRAVSDCDPVWVSAMKPLPTLAGVIPVLLWQMRRRKLHWPSRKIVIWLVLASLLGHICGNVMFQWSLGVIGIALVVPLTLGTIIVTGTAMGRFMLDEPVSRRTLAAVTILMAAVFVLTLGADQAHHSVVGLDVTQDSWWQVVFGVVAAIGAGVAYAILGVVIRYGVRRKTSVPMTLFVVSIVGATSLTSMALWRGGPELVTQFDARQYAIMFAAGLFNAIAFLALTRALQIAHMVYINAINGSQAAMAAIAGIVLFHEATTPALWLGLGMTVAGLGLLDRRA